MKRIVSTALVLSLLGGTSALAQTVSGDPHERRAEVRERLAERRAARAERREERAEAKQERREEKAEVKPERREHRAEARREQVVPHVQVQRVEPRREPRNRLEVLREQRHEQRREEAREERREERREVRPGQRVVISPSHVETGRHRDDDRRDDWVRNYRPGDGHRLRDRDRHRSHYDWRRWQRAYHAQHRYRAPVYIYPSRWYVRSWSFGDRLPYSSWYSQRYYIDWWQYGLPRPPIGTEWIRMRDDALLVDVWTGRVLAVYYDLFW